MAVNAVPARSRVEHNRGADQRDAHPTATALNWGKS